MDEEVTPDEEEDMIKKFAELIGKYDMETAAIFLLMATKPLVYYGGQMERLFISPLLPVLPNNMGRSGEKFFRTFEKRKNVDNLVAILEKRESEKFEKQRKRKELSPKRGWRRFFPFL